MQQYALLTFLAVIFLSLSTPACKHDPSLPGGGDPTDTIGNNPGDTIVNPGDTTGLGVLCDPDTAYFQNQILPLLISNCSEPGCHNEIDHQEGVIITSYQSLLATVENVTLNNWDENKLMRAILDDDPMERMPYNKPPLPQSQINLIAAWIQQGAKNNGCNENYGACDTINVSYSAFVRPLVQARCQGCHSGSVPQGGIDLSGYAGAQAIASNGKMLAVITRPTNWMPKGGARLDDCSVKKLKVWINAGAPEN